MGEWDFLEKDSKKEVGKKIATETKSKSSEKWGASKKTKIKRTRTLELRNLKGLMELPKKDEGLLILSKAYFQTTSFLEYFFEKTELKEAMLSSYAISQEAIDIFFLLLPQIPKTKLLVATSMKVKRKDFISQLTALEKKCNFNAIYKRSHTKNLLFSDGENFWSITGSGNFTNNSRLESYFLVNDKKIYDFIKEKVFDEKQ